jgi:hypothetical protein
MDEHQEGNDWGLGRALLVNFAGQAAVALVVAMLVLVEMTWPADIKKWAHLSIFVACAQGLATALKLSEPWTIGLKCLAGLVALSYVFYLKDNSAPAGTLSFRVTTAVLLGIGLLMAWKLPLFSPEENQQQPMDAIVEDDVPSGDDQ